MIYQLKNWTFEINDACLETFELHRQKSFSDRETGGQLFARIYGNHINIEIATETKGRSKHRRFLFWPDRAAERVDIETLFRQGLHYIGDWHTHPEAIPIPSTQDKCKMLEIYRRSLHDLDVMLMVIVGLEVFSKGLFVGAVRTDGVTSLQNDEHVSWPCD